MLNPKTIYIDMDGVVADWDAYVGTILGYTLEPHEYYPRQDWEYIKANFPRFYRVLELAPNALKLVDGIRRLANEHGYECKFLTAIPHDNSMPYAFTDKLFWAQKHFPDIPVWFGPYKQDKQLRSQPGSVLIDDHQTNIQQWNEKGGKGIFYVKGNHIPALTELEEFLKNCCMK